MARHSLIRAARDILGKLEQIHAHVQLRNVVTGRQSSLEEEHGRRVSPSVTPSISTRTCLELWTVSTLVYGTSRMNEDLLILLEPRGHLIPEKGEVAL